MLNSPISTSATINSVTTDREYARYKTVQGVATKNGLTPDQSIWNETTLHTDMAPVQLVLSRTEPKPSAASYGRSKLTMKFTKTVLVTGPDGVARPAPHIIEVTERCPVGISDEARKLELHLVAEAIKDTELANFFIERYL